MIPYMQLVAAYSRGNAFPVRVARDSNQNGRENDQGEERTHDNAIRLERNYQQGYRGTCKESNTLINKLNRTSACETGGKTPRTHKQAYICAIGAEEHTPAKTKPRRCEKSESWGGGASPQSEPQMRSTLQIQGESQKFGLGIGRHLTKWISRIHIYTASPP